MVCWPKRCLEHSFQCWRKFDFRVLLPFMTNIAYINLLDLVQLCVRYQLQRWYRLPLGFDRQRPTQAGDIRDRRQQPLDQRKYH